MAVLRAGQSAEEAKPRTEEEREAARPRLFGGGPRMSKRRFYILIGLAVAALAVIAWILFSGPDVPRGFARGNGRLEANEVYIATKYSGRVFEVLVDEGDTVQAGQVVARMDTETLQARLRQAEAEVREAESNRTVALAQIEVKQADFSFATQQYARSRDLVGRGAVSEQEAEVDSARRLAAQAELAGARAQATQAQSAIEAARAEVERLQAEIRDAVLVAPVRARVETRLAEPGEVLDAGGRVLSLIDLADVYMYVFLPEEITGRIPIGAEARIVLDAAPEYPIPARVAFVSPQAQFTPRAVETEEERHNLTFRVRLQLDRERLRRHEAMVKSGLPGVGYVRFDERASWPRNLELRTPPADLWQPTGTPPSGDQR
jgi:HlyD family secretion protein